MSLDLFGDVEQRTCCPKQIVCVQLVPVDQRGFNCEGSDGGRPVGGSTEAVIWGVGEQIPRCLDMRAPARQGRQIRSKLSCLGWRTA